MTYNFDALEQTLTFSQQKRLIQAMGLSKRVVAVCIISLAIILPFVVLFICGALTANTGRMVFGLFIASGMLMAVYMIINTIVTVAKLRQFVRDNPYLHVNKSGYNPFDNAPLHHLHKTEGPNFFAKITQSYQIGDTYVVLYGRYVIVGKQGELTDTISRAIDTNGAVADQNNGWIFATFLYPEARIADCWRKILRVVDTINIVD